MGFRFDYNSRKQTNGPVLFFSNSSGMSCLTEEIRKAVASKLSFYAYHAPGDFTVSFGTSEYVYEGISEPGFVIAPFNPSLPPLTIPFKAIGLPDAPLRKHSEFPAHSTAKESHGHRIEKIKEILSELGGGKIVAARTLVGDSHIEPSEAFASLCQCYPNSYVYIFSTPQTGCWIGATPELLLHAAGNTLYTMSLAGTRATGIGEEWDIKNLEEQQIVTDYISSVFLLHDLEPQISVPFTKRAGPVEHICTEISATIPPSFNEIRLSKLLSDLHPTPAVAGMPRELAIETIRKLEDFNRGCYSGFSGIYRSPSDFTFSVSLRCALIEENRYALFAGGGITIKSDSDSEWEETCMKASSLLNSLLL